jgi:tetrapyrrole methylase family protein/MazG family protein
LIDEKETAMLYFLAWPEASLEEIPFAAVRRMRDLDYILLGEQEPSWLRELPPRITIRREAALNALPSSPAEIDALARAVSARLNGATGDGLLLLPDTVLPQGRTASVLAGALSAAGLVSGGFWPYASGPALARLTALMAELRSPWGCPWDKEQTHMSLRKHLIEEACEAAEAMEEEDMAHLGEELGDVLFQIVFHLQIAAENGSLSWSDVLDGLEAKMIRRHPHIFGTERAETSGDVERTWEAVKRREKETESGKKQEFFALPGGLPALMLAEKTQREAAKHGFDWADASGPQAKIHEETEELERAMRGEGSVAEEVGDLLFSVVNLCRFLRVHGEDALRASTRKFQRRFTRMAEMIGENGLSLEDMRPAEMEIFWEKAKKSAEQGKKA